MGILKVIGYNARVLILIGIIFGFMAIEADIL